MYNLLKRIVYALCLLYSINLIIYNYGIIVPINIFTILIVTIFGIYGVGGIIVLMYLL